MMPLGDDNSTRKSFPYVTYSLIAINIVVFFMEMSGGEEFIINWSFVPSRFRADPISNISTVFTSMFMHAGGFHLFGNMLYLWIFGDNVEDRLGKIKYILFYLFCGIVATFAQFSMNSTSSIPNLGASGAIAGILGAYLIFFPKRSIKVMLGRSVTQMSALVVIGFWFALQFVSTVGSLASSTGDEGGVAYLAHVGGFVAGFIIATLIKKAGPKITE